jgi:GT2 family glycosyltransferase
VNQATTTLRTRKRSTAAKSPRRQPRKQPAARRPKHNVSFVTPSYNQGRFIERTIQSVLSQGITTFDYVVMDGGSTDETVEILKRYEGRLRWVSEKDNGQTHAINKGIQATSGDIIAWINSDDVYYPGAVQAAIDYFDEHPDVDVVYGDANFIDEHDNVTQAYPTEDWNLDRFKDSCFICQPATFFRRRVVERFGLPDERLHFCMDYDFWLRLAKGGAKFAHLKQTLAGARMYATNKTLGQSEKIHLEVLETHRRLFGRVPDRWFTNYAHMVLAKRGTTAPGSMSGQLGLAWMAYALSLQWNGEVSQEIEARLALMETKFGGGYKVLRTHVRETVERRTPVGARAIVISKGDPALLEFTDRSGQHFPQSDDGGYAGFHPASSADAIARLDALMDKGLEYLVIPQTAFWWLEYYGEFAAYLREGHEVIARNAHCIIYRLNPRGDGAAARPASPAVVKSDRATVVHVTHYKAGSQWILQILNAIARDRIVRPRSDLSQFLKDPVQTGMIYPTAYVTRQQYEQATAGLPDCRRFIIIRDLRDTLVSGYFSLRYSHPESNEHVTAERRRLNSAAQEEGFLQLLDDWLPVCADIQSSWLGTPGIIRYEDLLGGDVEILQRVLIDECGLDVSPARLAAAVESCRFEATTKGRPRGQEDINAHLRKGQAGDWRNYFTPRITARFKEKYGSLLVATGYEKDLGW